jgi:hypothetical protein
MICRGDLEILNQIVELCVKMIHGGIVVNDSIKRTRPVASVGAYYMPVKNQRIAADLYYQQLPFQSTGSATAYVNYTIGF